MVRLHFYVEFAPVGAVVVLQLPEYVTLKLCLDQARPFVQFLPCGEANPFERACVSCFKTLASYWGAVVWQNRFFLISLPRPTIFFIADCYLSSI
jgi:hypothetical protein